MPLAFLNLAARILKLVQAGTPADQALRESLKRTPHYSAPAERRAVSRAVFTYFRWWRWLNEGDSLQKQLEAALELQARFDKSPASIKPATLAARAVPDWFNDEMIWPESQGGADGANDPTAEAVGAVALNRPMVATDANNRALEDKRPYPTELAWLQQLQREPVLWIRVKRGLEAKVARSLGNCTAAHFATFSLPLSAFSYSGPTDLFHTPEFQAGDFEIQDLASQLVGHACAPQPGETWWDACAGEGGKTLHLADLMQNKGLIWASDRSARRLAKLKERAARAGVFNYRAAAWEGTAKLPTKTKFDGVLVDAPCSGIGTWQRNPHARWTTQPQDIRELSAVQTRLLDHVAGSVKSGGRLVYSVCTLARAETVGVASAFSAAHPEFEPEAVLGVQPSALSPQLTLWPQDLNANGMFIAAWRKK